MTQYYELPANKTEIPNPQKFEPYSFTQISLFYSSS
jgi:hypothetical protein